MEDNRNNVLTLFTDDFEAQENGFSDDDYFNNDKINIKTATGIITVKVKGSDTIGSIKLKIQAEERIPFSEQELIFNGMILEDINTLANLRIKKDSTLILMPKLSVFMNICIKSPQGRIIYLEVKPTDTIGDVKAKIKIKEGISVDEQVLIFNKMVLGDGGTLFDFHVNRKSTLTLMRKSRGFMQIYIKTLNGEIITMKVKPSYSIDSIKAKIQDEVHIPCGEQELIFNEMILRDIHSLADYNINKESTLTLLRSSKGIMQILIKTLMGETITLDVKPSDTVISIKAKIQDNALIHKVNFPCDEQELIFNDIVLHDNDILFDYNIKRESTLTLVRVSRGFMQIFIKIHNGNTITLEVKPSDTIRDVKTKIFDKLGCYPCDQRLVFNKRFLEDSPTLADYHIHKESTINIFTRS